MSNVAGQNEKATMESDTVVQLIPSSSTPLTSNAHVPCPGGLQTNAFEALSYSGGHFNQLLQQVSIVPSELHITSNFLHLSHASYFASDLNKDVHEPRRQTILQPTIDSRNSVYNEAPSSIEDPSSLLNEDYTSNQDEHAGTI